MSKEELNVNEEEILEEGIELEDCPQEELTEEELLAYLQEMGGEDSEEEECSNYEDAMGQLAVIEEMHRIERMENEDYVVPKEVAKSSTYKEGMEVAHLIISMTREMVHAGIDYANALQIANNFYMQKKAIEAQTITSSNSL